MAIAANCEIFTDREINERTAPLRDQRDPEARARHGRLRGDVRVFEQNAPSLDGCVTHDRPDGGRLPAPFGPRRANTDLAGTSTLRS